MKNKLIENIIENKPYYEEDAEYIKSINLGIPIHIIDMNILKKEIEELPITYRTILKLVDNGIEMISELSNIMGLEERIIEETLSGMSMQNLIYDIGSNIKVTKKGKDALERMKLVKIKEDILKDISINSITNKLGLNDETYNTSFKINRSLKEKEDITEEKILQRFDEINQIYKEEQKNLQRQYMETKHYMTEAISELQDIVSINKNRIIYDCKKVFLYYKDETIVCRIDDMNSEKEEIYLNEIYNQYSVNSSLLDVKYIKDNSSNNINYLVDKCELELNKSILEEDIDKYREERNETLESKIMGEYYTNRFLLDEEYKSLLIDELSNFKGTIHIQIKNLIPIIFDEEIFCTLKKLGSNKQEINIICLKNNNKRYVYRIKDLRKYNINIVEVEEILEDIIMFENKFAIIVYNKIYNIKDKANNGIIKNIYTMYVNQDILDKIKKSLIIR